MEIYDEIKSALNIHGLKVTPQRVMVYKALLKLNNHPDTDQIILKVLEESPSISAGTIYKTLDTLSEYGIINRIKTSSGRMRFDHITKKHHHIYDKKTDEITDYSDDDLDALLSDYFKSKKINGFQIEDINLQIIGESIINKEK